MQCHVPLSLAYTLICGIVCACEVRLMEKVFALSFFFNIQVESIGTFNYL